MNQEVAYSVLLIENKCIKNFKNRIISACSCLVSLNFVCMIEGKFTWFFSLNCAWNIRFYDLKLPSCDDAGAQFVLATEGAPC